MVSCRCFVAKLWWQRAVSGAGRAGGRKWGGGDFPLSCPPWKFSTDTFVILSRKKCQWKKRSMSSVLLHVPAGDGVLLCFVHIIVLSYMIVAYYIIIWYINYRALIALIFLYNCNVMVFLPQILKTLSLSQCICPFASSVYQCCSFSATCSWGVFSVFISLLSILFFEVWAIV